MIPHSTHDGDFADRTVPLWTNTPRPEANEAQDWSWCFRSFKRHIQDLLEGTSSRTSYEDDLGRDDPTDPIGWRLMS